MTIDPNILNKIKSCINDAGFLGETVFFKELSELTTLRSGGKCYSLLKISKKSDLEKIIEAFKKNGLSFVMIGNGSNILFNDGLIEMSVIRLEGDFDHLEFLEGNTIQVGPAYNLQKFIVEAAKRGLDFSYLAGIPGTIGGAVMGNSGAYGMTINDFVKKIKYISSKGKYILEKEAIVKSSTSGYRKLNILDIDVLTEIFLSSEKKVGKDRKELIKDIREKIKIKKKGQPLNTKNAGCFFKNPENHSKTAGSLIDQCLLKGFRYGGAMVSKKHANFIENYDGACSKDIMTLSKMVRDRVFTKFNIKLEYEVRLVGFNV